MTNITRRELAQTLVSAAALGAASSASISAVAESAPVAKPRNFPNNFVWGCATASYQIEGAATEDGRAPSVWDTFSHTPGKVFQGDTGDVACDSYHRYKEDVQLLKSLGVKGYRMSISWSRVFPSGKGKVNQKGLDYYNRVIDELLANGIQPYVTLFHWDLPQALPGGWQSRDTAKAFADYAGFMAKRLSDRVHQFFTINEFVCFTDLGYSVGKFAPGLQLPLNEVAQVRHHGVLAHGLGVQAIRANARAGTQIGLAENSSVFVPVVETAEHIAAAQRAHRELNSAFITAVLEGKYIDAYLNVLGPNAPKVESGDMQIIGSPIDFVGLNVYTPQYVRADSSPAGYSVIKPPTSYPHMASDWLTIGPECIYWAVRNLVDLWRVPAVYITENGCSADDAVTPEGRIEDTDRIMYLRNHLANLQRATSEGYPVKGYFLWSLLDNFEWADGYSKRFGLHYVDFKTLKRTPKLSAEWYRELIRRNELV